MGLVKAAVAAALLLAALAACGGEAVAPPATEGPKPTSTIDESAISGATQGLERTESPGVPGVPDRASEPLFSLEPVAEGLEEPVYVAAPASEPERLYIVERAGRIRLVEDREVRQEPFLDIGARVRAEIEEGLHSIAFHPDYAENRRLYVDYNDRRGDFIWPVLVYAHGSFQYCGGRGSITGGYVYRGSAIPRLTGRYLFGDFCSFEVWSLRIENGRAVDVRKEPVEVPAIVSFGEDATGELYTVAPAEGIVYRLVPPA